MKTSSFKINYPFLWLFTSIAVLGAVAVILIHKPYWSDEEHFIEAIRLFWKGNLIDSVKDYPEVTTPLFYLSYSAWGHLFGFSVVSLRSLSLLVAFATFLLLYHFSDLFLKNKRISFFLCLLLLINPYLLGISVFVFTDMMTLFFVLASLALFMKRRSALSACAMTAAILCRQYAIVFWIAILAASLQDAFESGKWRRSAKDFLFFSIGLLPLALLVYEWGGMAPPSGAKKWIIGSPTVWKPYAFNTYVGFSFLYLLPVLWLIREKLFKRVRLLAPALFLGCSFFLFGIRASDVARIQAGRDTVGMLHRAIEVVTGGGVRENLILYLSVSFGFWIFMTLIFDDVRLLKNGSARESFLLSFSCYLFLAIMPFSYQIWEKYLLLLLPVLAIRLYRIDSKKAVVSNGHFSL